MKRGREEGRGRGWRNAYSTVCEYKNFINTEKKERENRQASKKKRVNVEGGSIVDSGKWEHY